jgi:hypothetical protein
MARDRGTNKKEKFVGRIEKAKGRLQLSFPEIQQRARTSNAVEIAQSIFRQFADDIQLKDLLAKAESLVAGTNLTFTKAASKDAPATATFRDETSTNESSSKARTKKTPSKGARLRKAASKRALSKKKKRRAANSGPLGSRSQTTSAAEIARRAGVDPKAFRQALRDENLPWHRHNDSWTVFVGSPKHRDMQRVLARLTGR